METRQVLYGNLRLGMIRGYLYIDATCYKLLLACALLCNVLCFLELRGFFVTRVFMKPAERNFGGRSLSRNLFGLRIIKFMGLGQLL